MGHAIQSLLANPTYFSVVLWPYSSSVYQPYAQTLYLCHILF